MASIGHVEEEGDPWNGRRTPRHLEAPKELAKPNKKLVLSFIRGRSMCVGLRNKVFKVFFKPSEVTDGPEFGPLRTNVVASMKTSTEFPRWPLAGPESFNYPKEAKQCECKTVTHVGSSRCVKILL